MKRQPKALTVRNSLKSKTQNKFKTAKVFSTFAVFVCKLLLAFNPIKPQFMINFTFNFFCGMINSIN